MTAAPTLLPPNATPTERALESAMARLGDVPVGLRDLWRPDTAPAAFLPWLGWGLSIDLWDPDWTVAEKRAAIARAIADQRRKGTPASLRRVIDRFDPAIRLVEWHQANPEMKPHTARLELPLPSESAVPYSDTMIDAMLADIAAVKPLRVHLDVVHKLDANANAFVLSGAQAAGFVRLDTAATTDPVDRRRHLSTDIGEPLTDEDGSFLEDL